LHLPSKHIDTTANVLHQQSISIVKMSWPGSPAECQAAAPQCKAFVDDLKAKLGDSHTIECTGKNIKTITLAGHNVTLNGHALPKGTTNAISIDVCDDRVLSFLKDTLASKGTWYTQEFDNIAWMFM
jgi:hypothetical protein